MTASRLERSYRRLLLAYPRPYRSRYGEEILTTLMEIAAPEQRRPHQADAWHLLASGIRQRFRLPARRPIALVGAVLATVILAAFGAAAGSWLGWQTAADLPDDATIAATTRILGSPGPDGPDRIAANPWTLAEKWARASNARGLTTAQMSEALEANGWHRKSSVEEPSVSGLECPPAEPCRVHFGWFVSVRDGVRVTVSIFPGLTSREAGDTQLTFSAVEPAMVRPLLLAAGLLGGLAGWLIAAAVAQRSRGRRTPALLSLAALTVLALPTLAIYGNALRVFLTSTDRVSIEPAVHTAFTPGPYFPFGPEWQVLALSTIGGVVALVAVAIANRHPNRTMEQQPVVQVDS